MITIHSVWLCHFHTKLKGPVVICVPVLILPVILAQKIRLCSGSRVTSLFGGASPSIWPVCSTSLWLCSTPLVTMEMKVGLIFLLVGFYAIILTVTVVCKQGCQTFYLRPGTQLKQNTTNILSFHYIISSFTACNLTLSAVVCRKTTSFTCKVYYCPKEVV